MHNKPWIERYDAHVPASIQYPQDSLVDIFEASAYKYSDKTCLIFEDLSLTYNQVDELSTRLAKSLSFLGIKRGDKVGIVFPNIPQFILAYFAILKCGGLVVAMNPNYRQREFQEFFNITGVKVVFCLTENLSIIEASIDKRSEKVTLINTSVEDINDICAIKPGKQHGQIKKSRKIISFIEIMQWSCLDEKLPTLSCNDPAILQFSGGTTGTPKAAIGLHRNLVANTLQFSVWCNLQPGQETILAAIPLYHVYGMVLAMCLGIYMGAKIILMTDPRKIDLILTLIEKHQPTFFPGVPGIFFGIANTERVQNGECDLSSIKACISGAAPLSAEVKKKFEFFTKGKLMEGYGLSEAPTATHCNPLYGGNKTSSIGLPLPDVDCRLVDIEDENKEVSQGDIGELVISGPQVMPGYFNNPEESLIALKNGWLYTGDIAMMDKEGYFYLVDRKKSLIKVSGFQVWPSEIEKIINDHPAVKESCVGGVPEDARGEQVIAWVVLKPEVVTTRNEIINWCKKYLSSYKVPSEVIFIQQIPKTIVGKTLRRELIREFIEKQKKPE